MCCTDWLQGFFTKFLVGGLAFGDEFRSKLGTMGSQMGDSCRGRSQMKGYLENLSAEAKSASLQQN